MSIRLELKKLILFLSVILIPYSNLGEEIIYAKDDLYNELRKFAKVFAIGATRLVGRFSYIYINSGAFLFNSILLL